MLNRTTCAPGCDGGTVLGGRGLELDAIVSPILPSLGPIAKLGVDHMESSPPRKSAGGLRVGKGELGKRIEDSSRRPI